MLRLGLRLVLRLSLRLRSRLRLRVRLRGRPGLRLGLGRSGGVGSAIATLDKKAWLGLSLNPRPSFQPLPRHPGFGLIVRSVAWLV